MFKSNIVIKMKQKIVDLGKYTVATKWDDITLKKWSDYIRLTSEQKDKDNGIDIITTLEMFSDIPKEIIHQLPSDLFTKVISNLSFLNEEPNTEPKNVINTNDDIFQINIMEKLKVKEYLDLNTILENDKYNYPLIFAVLCRRPGEIYDEDFIADVLDDRIKMYEELPVTKALPLISFFLHLWSEYEQRSINSLMVKDIKETLLKSVKSVKNSLRFMDYITPSKVPQIMTLRKLEKSIKNL